MRIQLIKSVTRGTSSNAVAHTGLFNVYPSCSSALLRRTVGLC